MAPQSSHLPIPVSKSPSCVPRYASMPLSSLFCSMSHNGSVCHFVPWFVNAICKKFSTRNKRALHYCLDNPCALILVGYFVCHCHKTVFLFTASCWEQWSLWQGWAGIKSWNGMCVVTDSDPPPGEQLYRQRRGQRLALRVTSPTTGPDHWHWPRGSRAGAESVQ